MLKAASTEHTAKAIEKKKKQKKGGASSEREKALRLSRARSLVETMEVATVMDSGACGGLCSIVLCCGACGGLCSLC